MANVLSGTLAIAATHLTATFTDATTYSSPARTAVGAFMSVYKVSYQGEETIQSVTLSNADPDLASPVLAATFNLTVDGHYRFKQVAIPATATTTYSLYQAVFEPTTNLVYRCRVASIGHTVGTPSLLLNTVNWEPIPVPAVLADYKGTTIASANIDSTITNRVIGTLTADLRDAQAMDASLEVCTDCERNKDVDKYTLLDLFTAGLVKADSASEFSKGERIARRAAAL